MNWFVFRNWLASIEAEVEAAYEAGRQWGKIERAKGLPND